MEASALATPSPGCTACLASPAGAPIQSPDLEMPWTSSLAIHFNLVPRLPLKRSSPVTCPTKLPCQELPNPRPTWDCSAGAGVPFLNDTLQVGRFLLWEPGDRPCHYQDLALTFSPHRRGIRTKNLSSLSQLYAFV